MSLRRASPPSGAKRYLSSDCGNQRGLFFLAHFIANDGASSSAANGAQHAAKHGVARHAADYRANARADLLIGGAGAATG